MTGMILRSGTWRENAPLWGVIAVLAMAFAALAIFSRPAPLLAPADPEQFVPSTGEKPLDLDHLPATADDVVVLSDLSPADARARNAAVAIAAVGPGWAAPFAFRGSETDRIRARDCLALAGMAEAGGGDADQRAVMQVILNRVRHPAFAKTVCGVVFEGSERATGCQFSFTCDGSLSRGYPDAAWSAARRRAEDMLGGAVWAPVGNATHFHADYVYPWWSDKLDKVAIVGPHLFFRWRGFWGQRAAMSARYSGSEPDPMALRQTAQEVALANPLPRFVENGAPVRSIVADVKSAPAQTGAADAAVAPPPGVHFVLVSPGDAPAALLEKARALCPGERFCQVYGWSESEAMPARMPLPRESRQQLRFSFLAARDGNAEAVFFDCRTFPRPEIGQCLPDARK